MLSSSLLYNNDELNIFTHVHHSVLNVECWINWTSLPTQEAFLRPWPARTLESGLSIVILNRKSGLQSLGRPGSQKCLLGMCILTESLKGNFFNIRSCDQLTTLNFMGECTSKHGNTNLGVIFELWFLSICFRRCYWQILLSNTYSMWNLRELSFTSRKCLLFKATTRGQN